MPSQPQNSPQRTSSKLAEFISRHGVLIAIIAVIVIWFWQSLTPQQLFATDEERVQFLASVGAPPSTRIITLGAEWCPACKSLDHNLKERGIPYVNLDVERDPAGEALFRKVYGITSSNSIPKIILDKDIVSQPKLYLELARGAN